MFDIKKFVNDLAHERGETTDPDELAEIAAETLFGTEFGHEGFRQLLVEYCRRRNAAKQKPKRTGNPAGAHRMTNEIREKYAHRRNEA